MTIITIPEAVAIIVTGALLASAGFAVRRKSKWRIRHIRRRKEGEENVSKTSYLVSGKEEGFRNYELQIKRRFIET